MTSSYASNTKKRRAIDRTLYSKVSSEQGTAAGALVLDSSPDDMITSNCSATIDATTANGEYCHSSPFDIEEQPSQNSLKRSVGTASKFGVAVNLSKCICGAGSFALPHVFLELGVLGGTLCMTACGSLAVFTMQHLMKAKLASPQDITSYVQLADVVLGKRASQLVFALTLTASLGVCSTYIVFIGQTLESLSNDATSQNCVRQVFPDLSCVAFEIGTAAILFPLSCISDYSIFAFTSALGVICVIGGILVTLASGLWVDPGWHRALDGLRQVDLWPQSLAKAFGNSFGTIAYLFCINFLTFPIMNSMKEPEHYGTAVEGAVLGVWVVNVAFAILCLGFYGSETQDLVLANLNNGPYLSALKLFLCIDLFFTFPIVFSSGRQILEHAWIALHPGRSEIRMTERVLLVGAAVSICLALAQIGGFGAVANLVGGVAQGTLAFVLPPAIVLTMARQKNNVAEHAIAHWIVGLFGVLVVTAVTFSTASEMF
eukprot:scaffold4017_cov180-Amphora_coffeaeformis.AAC.7